MPFSAHGGYRCSCWTSCMHTGIDTCGVVPTRYTMAEKALALGIRARGQRWCGPEDLPLEDTVSWAHAQAFERPGPWGRHHGAQQPPRSKAPPFKAAPPGKLQANLVASSLPPASSHGHEPRSSGLGPCQHCELYRCLWV